MKIDYGTKLFIFLAGLIYLEVIMVLITKSYRYPYFIFGLITIEYYTFARVLYITGKDKK